MPAEFLSMIATKLAVEMNATAYVSRLERRAAYGGRKGRSALRRLREMRRETKRQIDRDVKARGER